MSDYRRATAKTAWALLQAKANSADQQRKFGFLECIGELVSSGILDPLTGDVIVRQRFTTEDIEAFLADMEREGQHRQFNKSLNTQQRRMAG